VPRWEVGEVDKHLHPVQILLYLFAVVAFGYSIYWNLNYTGFLGLTLFILATSYLIYVIGRVYGLYTLERDFIEITKDHVSFRSTPPFGLGWLPVSGDLSFGDIQKADIMQIKPFHNPNVETMAIQIITSMEAGQRRYIIGNNLRKEQLIKVGLALQGTVTVSNALKRLLGNSDELGEQLKDLVDIGKSFINSFRNKTNEGDP